jgi:DNA-binding transcriptional ArsR family regulator
MDVFEAVGDPVRREILLILRNGPMTAGSIAGYFSVSRPAISRHLRHLREAELVEVRVDGRKRIYRLAPGQLTHVRSWLRNFEPSATESLMDAFETEVYRARREFRSARSESDTQREESA